jgi:hypothetical protein
VAGATALCAVLLACASAASAAGPIDAYYQRSVMAAADARCGLFSPPLRAALWSAQAQARGAALRAGIEEAALARALANARAKAGSVACNSPDMSVASGRVRQAFDGYARLQRMTFAGDQSAWQAERSDTRSTWVWRLSQTSAFGRDRAVFGLAGLGAAQPLMVTGGFADGARPYAARLVMRDPDRAPLPSAARLQRGAPMAGRAPLRSDARIVLAEARSAAEPMLLPAGFKAGVQFRFPAQAVATLQRLDPREAVTIEFLISGERGEQVRTAWVEVGDFAAGAAFLQVAAR